MREVTLIKLGGSLITAKSEHRQARLEVIDRLAQELARTRRASDRRMILGHGSGSFGHPAADEFGLTDGVEAGAPLTGVSRTQSAARDLHRLVVDALDRHGACPFSLPPSSWMVAEDGELRVTTLEPIQLALELGLLPVVCGDVVLDRQRGVTIASTEAVLLALARVLSPGNSESPSLKTSEALWLGNTPGVLDPSGELIPILDEGDWNPAAIRQSTATDVTGGIQLRVETTFELARLGVSSLITDGRQAGVLEEALASPSYPGTRIPAQRGSSSG